MIPYHNYLLAQKIILFMVIWFACLIAKGGRHAEYSLPARASSFLFVHTEKKKNEYKLLDDMSGINHCSMIVEEAYG